MRFGPLLICSVIGLLTSAPMAFAEPGDMTEMAKAMSDKAAVHLKEAGLERAIADFNNPAGGYHDGELFVVLYDSDGKILATGSPALLNHDAKLLKDADGMEFGKAILGAPTGTWVNYRMTNPAIKKVEKKASYVNHVGEYTVFVGAYTR